MMILTNEVKVVKQFWQN